ncbi:hypothetical protein [Flavilitoribacter nigricans]|uniref:Uncharacterized protein n=1 Tax=Flavilitoribacter nigricans (strain ATCC 23147 / DSM 23189 / NBRC 102662 / NCIMB 1420 / SS-2) TaxID=1122177 RepID=A0A2D0MXC0_FLAN2|nr:hypothetical protein [Flavilitoribacter nigricans]PHN00786.1 hypothetical protein CRP01_40490 [Flavilitoribacter nigricans DSM 23189 = NBRC 102662]
MAKRQRKGFQPTIASSADQDKIEELARQLKEEKQPKVKEEPEEEPKVEKQETVRITIDIPTGFHKELKRATKMMGQTLKGYFLYLARQDIERKKERGDL